MLVNESSFDFALCVICYLSIALNLSYVLFFDLLAFYSTIVLCFFLFSFSSRSCLWPLLSFQFSFCKFRFSSLALVFGFFLVFAYYFCFLFFIYGFYLAFASCFCFSLFVFGFHQVLISHFYLSLFAYG
jgi:hypothetical protein